MEGEPTGLAERLTRRTILKRGIRYAAAGGALAIIGAGGAIACEKLQETDPQTPTPDQTPVPEGFGFEIPEKIKDDDHDGAVKWVQNEIEKMDNFRLTSGNVEIKPHDYVYTHLPTGEIPEFEVAVDPQSKSEFLETQLRWTGNFNDLFSRFGGVCTVRIIWNLKHGNWAELGLDKNINSQTPNCQQK